MSAVFSPRSIILGQMATACQPHIRIKVGPGDSRIDNLPLSKDCVIAAFGFSPGKFVVTILPLIGVFIHPPPKKTVHVFPCFYWKKPLRRAFCVCNYSCKWCLQTALWNTHNQVGNPSIFHRHRRSFIILPEKWELHWNVFFILCNLVVMSLTYLVFVQVGA